LQRYGEKNFRDLFVISGKWLGPYLEILSDFKGSVWKSGLRLDYKEAHVPLCKFPRISGLFGIIFVKGIR
jgi:hypothetical protein